MVKTYFVTASAYMHQNLFQRAETADLLLRTIFRYRDSGEFLLHEFVVMPNHIHLLLSVDDDHAIGRTCKWSKGASRTHCMRLGRNPLPSGNLATTNIGCGTQRNMGECGLTFSRIRYVEG